MYPTRWLAPKFQWIFESQNTGGLFVKKHPFIFMFVPPWHRHQFRRNQPQTHKRENTAPLRRTPLKKRRVVSSEIVASSNGSWVCAQCGQAVVFTAEEELFCEKCQGVLFTPQSVAARASVRAR